MYLHFTPLPIQWLFPQYTWQRKVKNQKIIFLTFDDGPLPEVTPFVLDVLEKYKARATFFCVGDNIRKHPEILKNVVEQGHGVGNHTFNHLNAFRTTTKDYLYNIQQCQDEFRKVIGQAPNLFRPPYGRIRNDQSKVLRKHYEVIMWDVLTADFDKKLSPQKCLQKSIQYTRNGSVVVFHDNPKAFHNLSFVLPRYLEHFSAKGYTFDCL